MGRVGFAGRGVSVDSQSASEYSWLAQWVDLSSQHRHDVRNVSGRRRLASPCTRKNVPTLSIRPGQAAWYHHRYSFVFAMPTKSSCGTYGMREFSVGLCRLSILVTIKIFGGLLCADSLSRHSGQMLQPGSKDNSRACVSRCNFSVRSWLYHYTSTTAGTIAVVVAIGTVLCTPPSQVVVGGMCTYMRYRVHLTSHKQCLHNLDGIISSHEV